MVLVRLQAWCLPFPGLYFYCFAQVKSKMHCDEAREGAAMPSSSRSRTHSSKTELLQHANPKTSIAPAAPHDSFLSPTHEGSYQLDAHAPSGSARALAAAVLRLAGTPQEQRSAAPFQLASCSTQRDATRQLVHTSTVSRWLTPCDPPERRRC